MTEVQSAYWDKQIVVKEVSTGDNTMMQVSITQKKGETYIAYREFYNTKSDPTWKPSKHGGATKIGYAAGVIEAMALAMTKAIELGMAK